MANELSPEVIAQLLAIPRSRQTTERKARTLIQSIDEGLMCVCGVRRDMSGYCLNPECYLDTKVPTFPCTVCGHCTTPEKCIASVPCPKCQSTTGRLCVNENGGFTTYHEERWEVVQTAYGTYYTNEWYGGGQ